MHKADIAKLLPRIFQKSWQPGTFLDGLLEVMENLVTPAERVAVNLDDDLNPHSSREDFVRFLAHWVDLDFSIKAPLGNLRALIASAADISKWRGTVRGLRLFLEIATGEEGFRIDDSILDRPFHLQVKAPLKAKKQKPLVKQIVEREKPAYMTWELSFE